MGVKIRARLSEIAGGKGNDCKSNRAMPTFRIPNGFAQSIQFQWAQTSFCRLMPSVGTRGRTAKSFNGSIAGVETSTPTSCKLAQNRVNFDGG